MEAPIDERTALITGWGDSPAEPREPAGPGRWSRPGSVIAAGWLPAGLLAAMTAVALWFYGVPLVTTALFGTYLALGIVLPGTLVWRALHGHGGYLLAQVAAGAAVGYAGEVLVYIPARWIGLPLLVLAWPIGTVAAFLAVPKLRPYWRPAPDRERPPALWNWALAGIVGLTVFWSFKFFRIYGLRWPYNSAPDTDSTFHLALVGEAKHHLPLVLPFVSDQLLYYHWFAYAEMAATSWVTGIEPQVLLLRLSVLPMLAVFTVLIAVLARRLFGHWWTGLAASVITLFVLAPDPYRWQLAGFFTNLAFSAVDDGSSLRTTVWTGPTQTFGTVLFVPVVLVLVDLLREHGRDRRRWALLVVLLCAVMGAKATYLPLLLAGLLLVVAGQFLVRRRLHRPALGAAAIVIGFVLFAQFVLFGGTNQGMKFQVLDTAIFGAIGSTGFTLDPRPWRLALVALLVGWCWLCIWSGLSGLVRHRRVLEPEILLLLGIGIAGAAVTVLFGQDGDSQRFFIEAARPYLAVAAAGGLAAVLPAGRLTWRTGSALIGAAVLGALAIAGIRALGSTATPTMHPPGSPKQVAFELVWPYLLTVAVALVAVLALGLARRRVPVLRGMSHALVIALLAGFGLATTYSNFARVARESSTSGWRNVVQGIPLVTEGTLEAGRWLRDHSAPDDVVATNAHCLRLWSNETCTNLHFSMAAYSERRMLVEGWGFTSTAHVRAAELRIWVGLVPYWEPEILAANDAVFNAPSAANVAVLRDRFGVRWLFVDETQGHPSPRLPDFVTLRYRSGVCAVYEIAPGPVRK